MLALTLGIVVSLWTLAGSVLLIQQSWNSRLPDGTAHGLRQRAPQAMLAAAQRIFNRQAGHWKLVLPYRGKEVAEVTYLSEDPFSAQEGAVTIVIDPYRARVLHVASGKSGVAGWLYEFHSRLLLGDRGKWWVGATGLILLGFVVSGALMWRLPRGVGLSSLHGWLGLVVLPVLMFSLVTGWLLVFSGLWTTGTVSQEAGTDLESSGALEMPPSMNLTSVLASLRRQRPGCRLRVVEPPFEAAEPWRVAVHCEGEIDHPVYWQWFLVGPTPAAGVRPNLEMETASVRLMGWVYALHSGQLLGGYGKCLMVAAGAMPGVLLITGLMLRWSRRRRQRKRHGLSAVQNPA